MPGGFFSLIVGLADFHVLWKFWIVSIWLVIAHGPVLPHKMQAGIKYRLAQSQISFVAVRSNLKAWKVFSNPALSTLHASPVVMIGWKTKYIYLYALAFFIHLSDYQISDYTVLLKDFSEDLVIKTI